MNADSPPIEDGPLPKIESHENEFQIGENVLKAKNGNESQKRRSAALNILDSDAGDCLLLASDVKRCCHSPDSAENLKNNEFSGLTKHRSPTIKIQYAPENTDFLNSSVQDFPSLKHPNRFLLLVKSSHAQEDSKIVVGETLSPIEKKDLCIEIHLKDIWSNTIVDAESTILIIDPLWIEGNKYEVNITRGLVIIEPHVLISTTILSQSLYCTRKSILQDRFRGAGAHFAMTLGSVVHELFQTSLTSKSSEKLLFKFRRDILPFISAELVALNKVPSDFEEELLPYLENIVKWIGRFMPNGENVPLENGMTIEGVHDIEDNIWSPTIGVKGKIDVTFKTRQIGRERQMIPLELKTGKTIENMDHKAQLLLYSLLLSERTFEGEIPPGVVLYLRDNTMRSVLPKMADLKGILNRRNLMVQPFSKLGIESLPEPLTNTRVCEKCQCSLTCSLLQKSSDDPMSHLRTSKEMSEFVDLTTIHLSPTHLEYAKKWLKWSILEWETAKRKKKFNDIFMDAPEKREENGNCLANVRLIKCEEMGSQNFHLSFSKRSGNLPHGIFERGEVVTVSTRTSYAILMGPIISYESQVITIRVDKFNLRLNNFYHLDKYEGYSTYGLHLGNIVGLMDATPYSTKIRELVIDKRTPTFVTLAKEDVLKVGSIIKELEGNQARAVVKGLTCKDYLLIQGLPGSGKTTTIVALVRCLLRLGRSVLLTAYTNSAVDNMVLRLKKLISEDQILRVASNSIHPDIRPLTLESKIASFSSSRDVVFEETRRILEKTPVIATTCLMAASNSLFLWRRFDVCIVDEASLALQTAVIKPISLANSFVLVGDSRQLAPLVLNNAAKSQGMTVSLLEHLAEGCVEGALISLNKQFRMNKQICGLSSTLFYENALICANTEIENRVVEIGSQENVPFNLSDNALIKNLLSRSLEDSVLFIDTKSHLHPGFCQDQENTIGSLSNTGEARLISKLCEIFIECDFCADEIGIMSAYRNQVDVLTKCISNRQIEINTIDQYQGRDKDLIFISLVHTTSQEKKDDKVSDKHLDEKRVNVALTRAKKKLVIIGCGDSMLKFSIISDLLQLIKNRVELSNDLLNDLNIVY